MECEDAEQEEDAAGWRRMVQNNKNKNYQGCSWGHMTRPAGRFRESHGSGRVGSGQEVFELSRVGSRRVGSG